LTVPVGAFPPLTAVTVAVSVTVWPSSTLEELDCRDVCVGACVMAMLTAFDVLALKLESPLYFAVIEC
jgi:hypothetical protein